MIDRRKTPRRFTGCVISRLSPAGTRLRALLLDRIDRRVVLARGNALERVGKRGHLRIEAVPAGAGAVGHDRSSTSQHRRFWRCSVI